MLLNKLNDSLSSYFSRRQTECLIRTAPDKITIMKEDTLLAQLLGYRWTVAIRLSCRSEFPIPSINPLCYGNTQTYCTLKVQQKSTFFKSKIGYLRSYLSASFSHSVLSWGILKHFWLSRAKSINSCWSIPSWAESFSISKSASFLSLSSLSWFRSSKAV